jgi:outer membrane protein OmpA-like peptidoglycan-associated protein
MNTHRLIAPLTAVVFAALLSGCSSSPQRPEGADDARARLTRLQADPELASRAPVAIREAEAAVRAAETPQRDHAYAQHLVRIADRKVDTAWALAEGRLYEDRRVDLSAERERVRLDARTAEADRARREADEARLQAEAARIDRESARTQADIARSQAEAAMIEREAAAQQAEAARLERERAVADADTARTQAEAARLEQQRVAAEAAASREEAEAARRQAAELERQVAELNARETERGLLITLGDVLFETGRADLKGGATNNLARLATFLNEYDDRQVIIEGHTDNVGADDYNQQLSQRRAEAVKSFLQAHGIAASRISASGKGESQPVSSNDSSTGRQQNRRVEVIISNPSTASR